MFTIFTVDDFSCYYCAGVGYEDYPTCKIPCRILGHRERHEADVKQEWQRLKRYWRPDDGPCPFCKRDEQCEHWSGLGWNNPKFEVSQR